MSNYFLAVTSKTVKSGKELDYGECDLGKLSKHLEQENKTLKDKHGVTVTLEDGPRIRALYKLWWKRISQGYNIIVQGIGSKKRLLDTFLFNYLNRNTIRVVSLHGFTFVSEQMFASMVMGMEEQTTLDRNDLTNFIESLSDDNQTYFIIHSIEELYERSRKVCEVIFELTQLCPSHIHFIASSDHLNNGFITSYHNLSLKLLFFQQSTYKSFFFERVWSSGDDQVNDGQINNMLLQDELTLQSLQSIYSALQENNKQILTYILNYFVKSEDEDIDVKVKGRRKSTKGPKKLRFTTLFKYTEKKFLARRQAQLRSYLAELIDHKIVVMEAQQGGSEESVVLLVPSEIAKKFLEMVPCLEDD